VVEKNETTAGGEINKTYYRIRKGDTLGAIARRNRTTVAQLQSMNGMRSTRLSIGENIVVKQEVTPVPEVKVEAADMEEKYQRVEVTTNSENIITEYLNKRAEKNRNIL